MIKYDEYNQIERPEGCSDYELSLTASLTTKAKVYVKDVSNLLNYINDLEIELEKVLLSKAQIKKYKDNNKLIETIIKIKELTEEIIPSNGPTG